MLGWEGLGRKESDLLEHLLEVVFPVCDAGGHHSAVDVVEWLGVVPFFVDVVDVELDVRRNTGIISMLPRSRNKTGSYKLGWIGDKSTPIT